MAERAHSSQLYPLLNWILHLFTVLTPCGRKTARVTKTLLTCLVLRDQQQDIVLVSILGNWLVRVWCWELADACLVNFWDWAFAGHDTNFRSRRLSLHLDVWRYIPELTTSCRIFLAVPSELHGNETLGVLPASLFPVHGGPLAEIFQIHIVLFKIISTISTTCGICSLTFRGLPLLITIPIIIRIIIIECVFRCVAF